MADGLAPMQPPQQRGEGAGAALEALQALTLQLRQLCPWDQVQTAGTIVPHTIEEAYEVAEAAQHAESTGDLAPLVDELGDLLFQICFLSMWCAEQQSELDFSAVARGVFSKLVRRHEHIYGTVMADDADAVRQNWDAIKRRERGVDSAASTALLPDEGAGLPALLGAGKIQRHAGGVGFDFADVCDALRALESELAELREVLVEARGGRSETAPADPAIVHELGDVLFATVNVARLSRVDPDLALRATSDRFRERVNAAAQIAAEEGVDFAALDLDAQETFYQRAKQLHGS